MSRLCANIFTGIDRKELYPLLKEAGFDGFFSNPEWADDREILADVRKDADRLGLVWETLHGSIMGCEQIWQEGPEGERYLETLLRNVDHCVEFGIPTMVVHPQRGRGKIPRLSLGLARFERVVERAKASGVNIAFENTDSPELLAAALERFPDEHAGFCYDSGHEYWLTPGVRFLPRFGKRLLCMHLNDNDCHTDQHWLPRDGGADFDLVCRELREAGYTGCLTLEVAFRPRYRESCTPRDFVTLCHERLLDLRRSIGA